MMKRKLVFPNCSKCDHLKICGACVEFFLCVTLPDLPISRQVNFLHSFILWYLQQLTDKVLPETMSQTTLVQARFLLGRMTQFFSTHFTMILILKSIISRCARKLFHGGWVQGQRGEVAGRRHGGQHQYLDSLFYVKVRQ